MTTIGPVAHIARWQDEFTAVRRDLHMHPELGFEEHRTAEVVCTRLRALGVEHHPGIGRTGVVAVIRGRSDSRGRSVGLRAFPMTRFLSHWPREGRGSVSMRADAP